MSAALQNEPTQHYEIVDGVTIEPFHSAHQEKRYLLTYNNRRFEINNGIYALIKLLENNQEVNTLSIQYSKIRNKTYTPEEMVWIIEKYVKPYGILKTNDQSTSEKEPPKRTDQYIYLKFKLIDTGKITPLLENLKFLFHKKILGPASIVLAIIYIAFFSLVKSPEWSIADVSISHLVLIYAIYIVSFLFHEIGHATACYRYGAKPGNIGMGIYLYFPVFYADVSDVWKLPRKQRFVVDIAGIYFQLIFSIIIVVSYLFSPHTEFLYYLLYIITLSVLFNLNPFFRFDGYWIFSDLAGISNLRKRSFELLRYLGGYIRGKKPDFTPYLFKIKRREKMMLAFYSIFSNLFFVYFFYRIPMMISKLITTFPPLLKKTGMSLQKAIAENDWPSFFTALKGILPTAFMLLIMSFLLYRLIVKRLFFLLIKKLLFKQKQNNISQSQV